MALYNSNQLSGSGAPIEALTSGSAYTFAVTSSISGSTYFTLETVRNSIGFYDSTTPTTAVGTFGNFNNVTGLVSSSYIFSTIVGQGGGSFIFTPSTNIAASGSFLRGTGGISLNIVSPIIPTTTTTTTLAPTTTTTTTTIAPFVNPTLTIGSAVSTVAQSPFSGGGNSYSFISSVNSYISTPGSSDWAAGTGDYTVEWFSYQTSLSQFQRIFTVSDYPAIDVGVSIESGTFYYWAGGGATPQRSISSATNINTWYHWAVSRQSGVTKIFKNGVQQGTNLTDTNNINDSSTPFIVGNTNTFATNSAFVGYITNLRWVKGLAVYTGDFTVPTSALTATAGANPYGGSNTQAISSGFTKLLLVP